VATARTRYAVVIGGEFDLAAITPRAAT